MAIAGLTDNRSNDYRILGRVELTVFKGDRKPKTGYGFGKDLNQKLRITTSNRIALTALKQSGKYGQPNADGDFLTDSINVYFPFDEVERTFSTNMKAYSASGLEIVCDRHTITKQCVPTKDDKGNVFRPIVDVSKECPMRGRGIGEQCTNNCVKEGKLYFYIQELMAVDMMFPVCLTTHSYEDLTYLTDTLNQFKQMIGSITDSPFPAYQYRHKIPFVLSRSEVKIKRPVVADKLRTGKKSDSTTWALTLQVNAEWMKLHRKWQQVREMEARNMLISQATVRGLLAGDSSTVIDVEYGEQQAIAPAIEVQALPSVRDKMRERITYLVNELYQLTGNVEVIPDLSAMSDDDIKQYGIRLKSEVDNAKEILSQASVTEGA